MILYLKMANLPSVTIILTASRKTYNMKLLPDNLNLSILKSKEIIFQSFKTAEFMENLCHGKINFKKVVMVLIIFKLKFDPKH